MRTSSFRVLALVAAQSLSFGLMACSSSTTIKPASDAAVDAPPLADAPPDATATSDDVRFADAPITGDASGADAPTSSDLISPDATTRKDATAPGDPAPAKDGTGPDLLPPTDLALIDVRNRDVASPDQAARDSEADPPKPCLADGGYGPACNDDPNSAAVMGTCQPDGTCKCSSDYALNPSTGRCRYPTRDGSASGTEALANQCTGVYESCMCSCCGTIGRAMACYYPTLGESVATLAAADEERWASAICGEGGCTSGTHYMCCTPADPEPSSAATYKTSGYVGGIDRLGITKAGADCASLAFAGGDLGNEEFRIDSGTYWVAENASFGLCGDAGTRTYAQGAIGTLTFRRADGACVMDLHVTLFAISDAAQLTTARMDAEGLPMPSILGGCPGVDP
jgi:hypothetical protein